MSAKPHDPQFVLEHAAHVRALARRLVFDGARAADLEQETWLAALRNTPREMTSPRGWLARIAQRRAVHEWRSESRREAREQAASRPEPIASPETILEREETRTQLVHAVLALDDPYRSALVAQFLEERPPREAARCRGLPVETQRTHVRRGLEILRERLKRGHGAAFGAFQLALVRDLHLEAPWGTTLAAASSTIAIGGLSMLTVKKVVIAGVAVAALVLIATRPWDDVDAPGAGTVQTSTAEVLAPATEVASPADATPRNALDSTSVPTSDTTIPATVATANSGVVVRARVVDESGRPIRGAHAVLRATSGPWAAGIAAETRFESKSDGSGAVRIEAPIPIANKTVLDVEGGPYRTLARAAFDPEAMRAIQPGDNDAGELVLRPAGQVSGRVVARGSPLADVHVGDAESVLPNASRAATDSDGRFRLGHLGGGPGRIRFSRKGFLPRFFATDVLAGQDVDLGDVELDRAPSIAGHVVDSRGDSLVGVTVAARDERGQRRGIGSSDADGSFRIDFDEAGTVDLEIVSDTRFRPWGGRDVPGARFATGDDDVRIVLGRAHTTTFVVTEAASGARLSEFSLAVRRKEKRNRRMMPEQFDDDWPRAIRAENGQVVLPAEPGVDEVFVTARGHVPVRTDVAHDGLDHGVQTLALERGSRLRARLLRDGQPFVQARVVLERAMVPLGPKPRIPGSIEPGRTHDWDLPDFAARPRRLAPSDDGSFEFDALASGTYKLTVTFDGTIAHVIELLVIAALQDQDLGDLVIPRPATLRGRVDTGDVSPAGWNVSVTGRKPIAIDREDGRFTFEGLPAGDVAVGWHYPDAYGLESERAFHEGERKLDLVLAEGEVREIVLDARADAPALLTVRVQSGGKPAADVPIWVALQSAGGVGHSEGMNASTDANGAWSQRVRPGRKSWVSARGVEGQLLAASETMVLAPGETRAIELDASTGDVEIVLADSVKIPASGMIAFGTGPAGEGAGFPYYWAKDPPKNAGRVAHWDGTRKLVVKVGAGTWDASIQVFAYGTTDGVSVQHDPITTRIERRITVRAGETTTVEVP